ncbi:MAG: helix-turn-helix domain-containing protein [Janthinobacterium lividum]
MRQARSRQGTSLSELRDALGIEGSLIASYTAGLENISSTMLCKIAAMLDTSLVLIFVMPIS